MVEAVPVELHGQCVEDHGVLEDDLDLWSISCQPGSCQTSFTREEVGVGKRGGRVQVEFLTGCRNSRRQASNMSIIVGQGGVREGDDRIVAYSSGRRLGIVPDGSAYRDGSDRDGND